MICDICNTLSIDRLFQRTREHPPGSKSGWNQAGFIELHPSFRCLIESGENGCNYCQVYSQCFAQAYGGSDAVLTKAEQLGQDDAVPVIAFLVLQRDYAANGQNARFITKLLLQIGTQSWGVGDDDRLCIEFRIDAPRDVFSRPENEVAYRFRSMELDYDLGSDTNFRIARDWIKSCCSDHDPKICPRIADTDLPTRLIDVGPLDGTENPRLIITSHHQMGRYIALSHCWGPSVKGKRLITTSTNIQDRRQAIPLNIMPANFRDATIVTRELGYRYLWIDSLCIIQDSAEDWERESAVMGEIYMKAAVTIAAAAANDSDGGMLSTNYGSFDLEKFELKKWFLIDRKETNKYALSKTQPENGVAHARTMCKIRLHDTENSPKVSLMPWTLLSDSEENWFRCVVVGPLAHRGWTLQERTLSHRILYYGSRQIYWQCASARKAADGESIPLSASTSSRSMSSDASEWPNLLGIKQKFLEYGIKIEGRINTEAEMEIHEIWRSILQIYVSRRLTKSIDKLPALAGMAALVHQYTGDTYVAGIWQRDLLVSLVWTPIPIWAKGLQNSRYVLGRPQWEQKQPWLEGPSWSWASADVEDALDFWGAQEQNRMWRSKDAEILGVETELYGQNPFGRVTSGKLVLKAFCYPRWDTRFGDRNVFGLQDWMTRSTCSYEGCDTSRAFPDREVQWDYSPRQWLFDPSYKLAKLILLHFLSMIAAMLGLGHYFRSEVGVRNCRCCTHYTCVNILSILSHQYRIDPRTEEHFHEVGVWSLVLEPVRGEENTFRRIGVARKDVRLSEGDYQDVQLHKDAGSIDITVPELFSNWRYRTMTII